MDILTQGVLGATVAQSAARKEHVRLAALIGFISGLIADADVLIRSSTDPLLSLEYHRHFTHSLFFIPVGAAIAFMLFWPFLRNKLNARILYFYCFMGYLLSGVLDACTSYGTHLLWPIINSRIAWNIISIVDPIFTGVLVIGLIVSLKKINVVYSRIAFLLAGSYLLFATLQLHRAENTITNLAQQRGHTIEQSIVKPTIGNTLLWRSVYLSDGVFYIDAVRAGINTTVYTGTSINKFKLEDLSQNIDTDSTLFKDIQRFNHFSEGFVIQYPDKPTIIGDVRYSMNPTSHIPLWGIEMNLAAPREHVKYEFYRETSRAMRQQFVAMLFGRIINTE